MPKTRDLFTRKNLKQYFETLYDPDVADILALSILSALNIAKKKSPKAPLKKQVAIYLPYALRNHFEKASESYREGLYDIVSLKFDNFKKEARTYDKPEKPITIDSDFKKIVNKHDRTGSDEDLPVIVIDVENSFENGVDFGLNDFMTVRSPEAAYDKLGSALSSHGQHLSNNRGTYAFFAFAKDGHIESYAGIARLSADTGNHSSGYVNRRPTIGSRNVFEFYQMIHSRSAQFFEKRFGLFSQFDRIANMPMIQVHDATFHALKDHHFWDLYSKAIESFTMGLIGSFGIQSYGAGLNIKRADDAQAFLAGLSLTYPNTYRDLIILQKGQIVKDWSVDYIANLYGLWLLYASDSEISVKRDPEHPETFRKPQMTLLAEDVLRNPRYTKISKESAETNVFVRSGFENTTFFTPGAEWNVFLDRMETYQKTATTGTYPIEIYRKDHETGSETYHDLMQSRNRATRLRNVLSIFSDEPVPDMTWALSNLKSRIKYEDIGLDELPIRGQGESLGDFKERQKLFEETAPVIDVQHFRDELDVREPER